MKEAGSSRDIEPKTQERRGNLNPYSLFHFAGNYLKEERETDTKERKRFGMSSLIPLRLLLPPLSPTITLQYPPFQLPSSKSSFKSFSSSYLPCAWNTTSSPSKRRKVYLSLSLCFSLPLVLSIGYC